MPNAAQAHLRIKILIVTHLLVGTTSALAIAYEVSAWFVIPHALFCTSALLLVGIWSGLANVVWWMRLVGFVVGLAWVVFLFFAPLFSMSDSRDVVIMLVVPIMVIAILFAICRRFSARIKRGDTWPPTNAWQQSRFTMKSLFIATTLLALMLGYGGILRQSLEPPVSGMEIAPPIALSVSLVSSMLVKACLGLGRPAVPLLAAIAGSAVVGLLPAYCFGAADWEFAIFAAIAASIATVTSISLLIIRSCGYRLVPISRIHDEAVCEEVIANL